MELVSGRCLLLGGAAARFFMLLCFFLILLLLQVEPFGPGPEMSYIVLGLR